MAVAHRKQCPIIFQNSTHFYDIENIYETRKFRIFCPIIHYLWRLNIVIMYHNIMIGKISSWRFQKTTKHVLGYHIHSTDPRIASTYDQLFYFFLLWNIWGSAPTFNDYPAVIHMSVGRKYILSIHPSRKKKQKINLLLGRMCFFHQMYIPTL